MAYPLELLPSYEWPTVQSSLGCNYVKCRRTSLAAKSPALGTQVYIGRYAATESRFPANCCSQLAQLTSHSSRSCSPAWPSNAEAIPRIRGPRTELSHDCWWWISSLVVARVEAFFGIGHRNRWPWSRPRDETRPWQRRGNFYIFFEAIKCNEYANALGSSIAETATESQLASPWYGIDIG